MRQSYYVLNYILCYLSTFVLPHHLWPIIHQMPWEDVKKEMVNEKGLSEEAADQIGEYVSMQGETTDRNNALWLDTVGKKSI